MNTNSVTKTNTLEVKCILGKQIRTTQNYWQYISQVKHADLAGQLEKVFITLKQAEEVWQDEQAPDIFLYYYKINQHWICVVARHLNGDGFIVTTYLTHKSKRKGKKIWSKKK
ncbi:MAG: DUF4258 domain-containing protein [Candidatus Kuenenbacteria bacterium]